MRKLFVAVMALLISACNSVDSEVLPTSADDPRLAEIGKQLGDEDKKLLVGYLMRRELAKAFGGNAMPDGAQTVGDAITAQQKWLSNMSESEKRAETLKAETEQKRKVVAQQINQGVTVAFLGANFVPSSYESGQFDDSETFDFAVHNRGAKPIKALKGQAIFIDTFGEEFVKIPMQFEEAVAPSQKKNIQLSMEINKFMDEHKKIMTLDSSKRFRFEPEQIVYEDGSTLRAPEIAE